MPTNSRSRRAVRLRRPRRLGNGGFGMLFAIFVLASVALVATAITAIDVEHLIRDRRTSARERLEEVSAAVARFRAEVQANPGSLTQLTTRITTADVNSCGLKFKQREVDAWNGPYLQTVVPTTGLRVRIGMADLAFRRDPKSNQPGDLVLNIRYVRPADADYMDRWLDGESGRLTGILQWGNPDPKTGDLELEYRMPVSGC